MTSPFSKKIILFSLTIATGFCVESKDTNFVIQKCCEFQNRFHEGTCTGSDIVFEEHHFPTHKDESFHAKEISYIRRLEFCELIQFTSLK
jgi:hypothetical protein